MKKHIHTIIKNPLVSGGAVVFFGFLSGNFFNFLFNVFMSRNLSVSDYGTLASLVSIILLFALATNSFMTTVVHFASSYFASGEIGKARALLAKINQLVLIVSGISFLLFVFFNKDLGFFLNIDNRNLLILLELAVLFTLGLSVNQAFLQAKLAFSYITFVNIFSSCLKLLLGIALVLLGFGVSGAMWSFLIAYVIAYIIQFIPLRFLFFHKDVSSQVSIKAFFSYGGPATLSLLSLASFISADIILVKHFYLAKEAGVYAGLSLLGKIIYFFSSPIVTVMFPLIVQRHTRNEEYRHLFKIAVLLTFVFSLGLTIFYYLFPEIGIKILLKREEYLTVKSILWYFGVYMTVYSVLAVFVNFFLSIKKTKIFIPTVFSTILQLVLLWFFHNSFSQIITVNLGIVSLLLFILLLYYWRLYGTKQKG